MLGLCLGCARAVRGLCLGCAWVCAWVVPGLCGVCAWLVPGSRGSLSRASGSRLPAAGLGTRAVKQNTPKPILFAWEGGPKIRAGKRSNIKSESGPFGARSNKTLRNQGWARFPTLILGSCSGPYFGTVLGLNIEALSKKKLGLEGKSTSQ